MDYILYLQKLLIVFISGFDPKKIFTLQFFIFNIFPLFLSAITIKMTIMAGNLSKNAWLLGLFNQLLWLIWVLYTGLNGREGNMGFLPMNLAFWYVYYKNHVKWKNDKRIK